MANVTMADMAQSFALRRQNTALQAEVQRLSTETVTGLAADTGRAVGGDFTALSAITGSLSRLEAYGQANTAATTVATGTQNALAALDNTVSGLGARLTDQSQTGNSDTVTILSASAEDAFRGTVGILNTRVAGQTLFAGNAVNGPALADAETILSALQDATGEQMTAAGLSDAIDRWFASDFGTVAYVGGADRAPVAVGEGDLVDASATASNAALVDTLKGLAMGALLSRGALADQPEERQAMAHKSGEVLVSADAARVVLAARIGGAEGRLADIQTRNTAQIAALDMARTQTLAVDPYESAVRLEAAQTQVETLYSVTARLSKMSLADFL